MAIAYPLDLPTITGVKSINLRTLNAVGVSRSPFTFKEQVFTHQGQMFQADIELPTLSRSQAEHWVTFLVKLKGQQGTFLLGDPTSATSRGSAASNAGTPVVQGAGQTGDTLSIQGAPANQTGYLLKGDYIQLGSGSSATLHKVLNDVNTGASGTASLDIYPAMRTAASDGGTVIVSNARGVFRLASNQTDWSIDDLQRYSITFQAIEAIA